MNGYPDNRELRARCTLSVMNAGQNGSFFSGDYSAASSVRAAENTEVANSSFNSVYNVKGVNYKKFSSRLKNINSLSNGKIPEVNPAPSASSATFAFGGIVPGEAHPVFTKLVGPTYAVQFTDEPKKNTVSEPQENYVEKNYAGNHLTGQIIRSSTSPALNYGEAQSAESNRDFVHKMGICLKELRETNNCLKII